MKINKTTNNINNNYNKVITIKPVALKFLGWSLAGYS